MTELLRPIAKLGTRGKDVEALTRAQFRYFEDWDGLAKFNAKSELVRRSYDAWDRDRTKAIQRVEGIAQTGVIGPATFGPLLDHFDEYAASLYRAAAVDMKPKPVLIEPRQGWSSLHRSLWAAFSEGRRRGLSDLGTYNPRSTLPGSGRPSDHAVYPAFAFDLGIEPDTGWNNLKARTYAIWASGLNAVEYVILGDRIYRGWFKVWGSYRGGGHLNHVHVSGWR